MVHLQEQQSLADAHSQHRFPARKDVVNQYLEFVADVSGPWLTPAGEMIITSVVVFTLASVILLTAMQTIRCVVPVVCQFAFQAGLDT